MDEKRNAKNKPRRKERKDSNVERLNQRRRLRKKGENREQQKESGSERRERKISTLLPGLVYCGETFVRFQTLPISFSPTNLGQTRVDE